MHLSVLCGSSEQTAIISLYSINLTVLKSKQTVFTARYEMDLQIGQIQFRTYRVRPIVLNKFCIISALMFYVICSV